MFYNFSYFKSHVIEGFISPEPTQQTTEGCITKS